MKSDLGYIIMASVLVIVIYSIIIIILKGIKNKVINSM